MKRIFNFLFVGLLALSLTGCLKHNVAMEVSEDKSVTLEIVYEVAIDKSLTGEMENNSTVDTEEYKFLQELGYEVKNYEEERDNQQITGVKVTKKFDNIDDITADKKNKVNLVTIFNEENKDKVKDLKLFYKDNGEYVSNFEFNYQEEAESSGMSSYQSMFNLEYKVKLPKEATRNNATSVSEDKTEYTWKLDFSKNNDIDYAFKLGNNFNMIFILLGVGAIALIVIIIVVVLLVSKSKKKNNNMVNNQPNMMNNQSMNTMNQPNMINNQSINTMNQSNIPNNQNMNN